MVVDRAGVNQRQLAKHFSVSRFCVMRNLKKRGIEYYKRQKAPEYDEKQLDQIPKKCRKLRRVVTNQRAIIVMDDEKYFTLSGGNMPRNVGFLFGK